MFFYFSFLRTPPQSSLQSSSVVFTPQVTIDLRTEPFPTIMDIYCWWISCCAPGPQNVTRVSEPAKVTTWRRENAYKPSKKLIGAAAARPGIDFNPCAITRSAESHYSPFARSLYEYQYLHNNNDDDEMVVRQRPPPTPKVQNKRRSSAAHSAFLMTGPESEMCRLL
jgi:hypothetical protein